MRAVMAIIITLGALAPVAAQLERLGDFEWAAELSAEQRAEQHIDDQEAHSGKYSVRYETSADAEHPTYESILLAETFETAEFEVEAWIKVEGEGSLCLVYPDDGRTSFEVIESPTDGWQPLKLHLRANPSRDGDENYRLEVNATLRGASGKVTWWLDDAFVTPLYQHQIPKTGNPPVVDGDLSDPCWGDEAYVGDPYWRMYNNPRDAQEPTHVWCCYDDQHLYVAFRCVTRGPDRLVAEVDKHDGPAWRDDSAEIFFNPSHDHARYYEYIVTPRDVVFDSKWWREGGAWQVDWHYFGEWKAAVERDAWTVEIALELRSYEERDLQGNPTGYMALPTGDVAGILFSRNDRVLEEGMSWADCIGSFHEVHQYGHLVGFRPLYTEGYRKTALREVKRLQERWDRMYHGAGRPEPVPSSSRRADDGTESLPEALSALWGRAQAERPDFDEWVAIGKEIERLDDWLDRAETLLAEDTLRAGVSEGLRDDLRWGIAVASPLDLSHVRTAGGLPKTLHVPDVIRVSAARGEYEPIRLALFALGEQPVRIPLAPPRLEGEGGRFPASCVRFYALEGSQLAPVDGVEVEPGKPREIWCVIEAPESATPGTYRARRLLLFSNLGMELVVRHFALPRNPSLPVSVAFQSQFVDFYWLDAGRLSPSAYWPFAEELLRHRVTPREMLADFTDWSGETPDFTLADETLTRAELEGYSPGALIIARPKQVEEMPDPVRFLQMAEAHWRGRIGRDLMPTLVTWPNEVPLSLPAVWLARSIACGAYDGRMPQGADLLGVWALPPGLATSTFGLEERQERIQDLRAALATQRQLVWDLGLNDGPGAPGGSVSWRMVGLLAFKHRAARLAFGDEYFFDTVPPGWAASGLLYTGEKDRAFLTTGYQPMAPTVRLELLREGLEDYEYLHMLAQLNRRLGRIGGAQKHTRLQRENSWLLKLDYRIIKNVRSYTHDPEVVMQWREALARQIERTRRVLRQHGEEGLPGD